LDTAKESSVAPEDGGRCVRSWRLGAAHVDGRAQKNGDERGFRRGPRKELAPGDPQRAGLAFQAEGSEKKQDAVEGEEQKQGRALRIHGGAPI
jgi:hypothetical protein